jgi:uncharacterized membrane protein
MKHIPAILVSILLVTYPLCIYFGLQTIGPKGIAIALFVVFFFRLLTMRHAFSTSKAKEFLPIFVGVAITSGLVLLRNDPFFLRLNPVLINLNFLVVFGVTLARPPSMVERFARLQHPDLSEYGARYTRKVTWAWCAFFVINGGIALWTVFQSLAIWTLYNGLLSYIAMGLFFGIEYMIRIFHMKGDPALQHAHQDDTQTAVQS